MRCLALAERLQARGAKCTFLCRVEGLGELFNQIVAAGHELLPLTDSVCAADTDGPPHAGWLPGGQAQDVAACNSILAGRQTADWLVVDHYAMDCRWESCMRSMATRIMVIDDLADRMHDCDLLVDQSFRVGEETRYDELVPGNAVRLLGPKYALLRPEFVRHEPIAPTIDCQRLRILVMYGGADVADLTSRSIDLLVRLNWKHEVDVVAGPLYPHATRLACALTKLPRAKLHAPAHDVATLMKMADIAFGSPGVSSWERCACGLPSITVSQADNQVAIGVSLAAVGACRYLGRVEEITDARLENELMRFVDAPWRLREMALAAAEICDGHGSERVADELGRQS